MNSAMLGGNIAQLKIAAAAQLLRAQTEPGRQPKITRYSFWGAVSAPRSSQSPCYFIQRNGRLSSADCASLSHCSATLSHASLSSGLTDSAACSVARSACLRNLSASSDMSEAPAGKGKKQRPTSYFFSAETLITNIDFCCSFVTSSSQCRPGSNFPSRSLNTSPATRVASCQAALSSGSSSPWLSGWASP